MSVTCRLWQARLDRYMSVTCRLWQARLDRIFVQGAPINGKALVGIQMLPNHLRGVLISQLHVTVAPRTATVTFSDAQTRGRAPPRPASPHPLVRRRHTDSRRMSCCGCVGRRSPSRSPPSSRISLASAAAACWTSCSASGMRRRSTERSRSCGPSTPRRTPRPRRARQPSELRCTAPTICCLV